MNNDDYEASLMDLQRALRHRSGVISILACTLLVMAVALYKVVGSERVVVVPPNVSAAFWCQADRCGNAYLEQMGGYVAWLILDVAPSSVEWKKSALLGLVSPDIVGMLKQRQELEGERLKRLNASTYFLPQQMTPDEEKQTLRITGLLHTQINGNATPPVARTYEVAFNHQGGRTHLARFMEFKHHGQASLPRSGTPVPGGG